MSASWYRVTSSEMHDMYLYFHHNTDLINNNDNSLFFKNKTLEGKTFIFFYNIEDVLYQVQWNFCKAP